MDNLLKQLLDEQCEWLMDEVLGHYIFVNECDSQETKLFQTINFGWYCNVPMPVFENGVVQFYL